VRAIIENSPGIAGAITVGDEGDEETLQWGK
jgi:hypothetical protein